MGAGGEETMLTTYMEVHIDVFITEGRCDFLFPFM